MNVQKVRARLAGCLAALFAVGLMAGLLPSVSHGQDNRNRPQGQSTAKPKAKLGQLRTSETARGTEVTISATEALNDYKAYRSGDKFYVVIPNADAGTVRGGARGRGLEESQVEKRGGDVVLTFRLPPGAKPRVQQRFNKLDVVFDASDGQASNTTTAGDAGRNQTSETRTQTPVITQPQQQQSTQTPAQNDTSEQARNQVTRETAPPTTTQTQTATTQPPQGDPNALPPSTQPVPSETQPAATGEATPVTQVADARQPESAREPLKITTDQPAQTGTAIGATILRNWPVALIAALLLVGLGLFFAARRSSATKGAPESAAAAPFEIEERKSATFDAPKVKVEPKLKEVAPVETVAPAPLVDEPSVVAGQTEVEQAPAAVVVAMPSRESRKADKKKKKRGKKGQQRDVEEAASVVEAEETFEESIETAAETPLEIEPTTAPTMTAPAVEEEEVAQASEEIVTVETTTEETTAEPELETTAAPEIAEEVVAQAPAVEAPVVEESPVEESVVAAPVEEMTEVVEETATFEESLGSELEQVSEPVESVAFVPALPTTEITPAASTLDADAVQVETRHLLNGEPYDQSLAAVSDPMMRQMIAAELLAALAGRNAERKERARAAYIEHGYFNETVSELHGASAPAARASAARSLGLAGDRAATSHLVAALEDDASDVRRAAVEALASVRDPAAVGPLEALLEREKSERIKLPRKLIQHAIDACAEAPATAEAFAPAAPIETTQAESPAVEVVAPAEESRIEELSVEESPTVELTLAETDVPVQEREATDAPTSYEIEMPTVEVEAPTPVEEETRAIDARAMEEEAAVSEEPPLEFEIDRSEPPVETDAKPIEEFKTPPREAVEDWIELDMLDAVSPFAPTRIEASHESARTIEPVVEESEPAHAYVVEESVNGEESPLSAVPVGEVGQGQTTEILPALEVETPTVQRRAPVRGGGSATSEAKSIAVFSPDEMSAVPKAIQLRLASEEPEDRALALKDLAHVNSSDAFNVVCAGFDDPAVDVRSAAARSLYNMNADRAEAFTRAMREAEPQRRRNIGAAIASSGLASEALSRLTGESREKTYDAFSLLFLMAKAGEVQPLIKAVESHPDTEVRLAVVKLLALSGQKEVLPAFRRLAVRGSLPADVRAAVMEAIYQISSQTPVA